jgi:Raf kinase inhibitor-like YbhB/YbcL family protein
MALTLTSSAFADNGPIPARYTCEGDDVSPPLAWTGAPPGTRSLVLIVDDPDAPDPAAPRMTWVHWVVYDLPATASGLEEGADRLPGKARHGLNDWKRAGYGGPCPPVGRHRYVHKLYALDTELGVLASPTKPHVLDAMQGHVLAEAFLIGTYAKHKS